MCMQTAKIYQIDNSITVLLVGPEDFLTEWIRVYTPNIKFYNGLTNPLKIRFLNADQKSVNIENIITTFNLFEPGSQVLLFAKTIEITDSGNGIAQLTVLPTDIANLQVGQYEASFSTVDTTGNITACYINDHYGSRIPLELNQGPVNILPDPTTLLFTHIPATGNVSQQVNLTYRNTGMTTFTVQGELDQYTGNLLVQGTLIGQPTDNDFANLAIINYNNVSGPFMESTQGTFAYIQYVFDGRSGNANATLPVSNASVRF